MDCNGDKIESTRYSSHPEIIEIASNLIRSTELKYRSATVSKLCQSEFMSKEIHHHVVEKLSKKFTAFINCEDCPLRNPDLLEDFEKLTEFDFEDIYKKCKEQCGYLMNSISVMCFGVNMEREGMTSKYLKQSGSG